MTQIREQRDADKDYRDCTSEEEDEIGYDILQAHKLDDPLELLETNQTFTCKNGSLAVIKHFKVKQLSSTLFKWIMDLLERNMKTLYEQVDKWKPRAKKREMTEKNSRYLIAFIDNKPVAYSHFQFDMDYGRQVLYCYEIQLETGARGSGLGKRIMKTLEEIALATRLSMSVLTVFKQNQNAVDFFRKIGYEIDETSPEEQENKPYLLLSKQTEKID